MKKILSIFTAMLCAIAVSADPVVLPATLDVSNVSFRSEGMPDFVIEEGQDYAGTYFDMGAHDSANDTLLYAEWDVTIEPIKYNIAVDVYNTNSWRVQLYLLNQTGDTLKSLRYKGSSGQCGQYAMGALDLSDLAAGNYKVRVHAATAWSAMKLKDVIFAADYAGVNVDLPGTLLPDYALLSEGASVANGAIAFAPATANNEYATWNVSFAVAGNYNVTIDMTASNGHTYGVALLSADGATEIGAVAEEQAWDTGVKALGAIAVPAAGNYKVKLTNATQWSEAVLNSITFAAPAPAHTYTVAGSSTDLFGTAWDPENAANDMVLQEDNTYKWEKADLTLAAGEIKFKVVEDHAWDVAYPASDYVLNIQESGIYTIAIYFNPNDNNYVGAVATKTGDAVVIPSVAMHGNFLGSWADTENFAVAEGDATASLTLNLAAGSYEFGMRIGGSGNWTSNGVAFTRENNAAEVVAGQGNLTLAADVAGEYTFTWTYATNNLAITFPAAAPVVDEWAEIAFAEAAAADDIAEEASFTIPGMEFALTLHDSGNKMVIDGNDCRFGTAEAYTMYNFRIKSGGASSSTKNYFTLNIPEAGTLRLAPRTGSNSATDRALVIAQGETELYNAIVQESQAIEVQEGENTVKVYPYVDVTVAAGEVRVSYTAGMNFYAFAFKAAGGDEPQPQECDWDAIDFLGDGSVEQTHSNQFKVCKVGEQPNVVNIQTPGFAAETGIYVTFPSAVFGEISLAEGQYVIEGAGMVLYLSAFTQEYTEVTVNWDGNDIVFTVYNAAAAPQPVEHTYTVAGGSADLFGTAWDPTNAANDMTKLEDGTYKWEKTEITLPAGNVEFKVCEDHAWTVCYPAENYQLVIPEAGVYTITITYNPEGNVVAADAVKTGDAQVDPVVSIAGSMNSWNASADVMVLAEDKATASLTLNLAAQTYEFKVVMNGSEWRSNAHEFTRENATAAEMTGNLDNMHLVADVAGDYIFTWTFETNTLSIAFPIGDGIDNTAVENKAIKRIVNGQLFIEMNGVLYNAQGTIVR